MSSNQRERNADGAAVRVEQWTVFEVELPGPTSGNPFSDVDLRADFRLGNRTVPVRGFYDGDGLYRIRFMPDACGDWSYTTVSNTAVLSGISGSFTAEPASDGNHGPVRAVGACFAYADGSPYVPIGTTAYAWAHQSADLVEQTFKTLESAPFTKIRMCVFPKDYSYNKNEPDHFAFPGSLDSGFDHTRFDPEFFHSFEAILARLLKLGIEADIILFHPYDRWGFQSMPADVDDRYLRYVIARFAAFRHVWWSMANEWDFMKAKTSSDFDRYFRIVQEEDPYGHLRSVHNGHDFYDHGKPWVTHCSIQSHDVGQSARWRELYKKPIVIDECSYEGNIPEGWGNISARELTRRLWSTVSAGGWPAAHGETYYNEEEVLWWSKGGTLTGDSVPRIAFLKTVLDDAPTVRLAPLRTNWDAICVHDEDRYFLWYFGLQQPAWKILTLPESRKYRVDVIDTWNMTVETVGAGFSGPTRVELPSREYIAVRCVAEP